MYLHVFWLNDFLAVLVILQVVVRITERWSDLTGVCRALHYIAIMELRIVLVTLSTITQPLPISASTVYKVCISCQRR